MKVKLNIDDPIIEARRFAIDTVLVMIARSLIRFRGIIIIPCLTLAYGLKEYGIWVQIDATIGLVSQFLTLRLETAIVRFLPEYGEDNNALRLAFGTLLYTGLLLGCIIIGVVAVARGSISKLLFASRGFEFYALLAFLWILFRSLFVLSNAYIRAKKRIRLHTFLELLMQASVVVVIIFASLARVKLSILLVAVILTVTCFAFCAAFIVVKETGLPKWSLTTARRFMAFSLPLVPLGIMRWAVNVSDRYLITHLLSLEYTGYYAICYALGSLVGFVSGPIYSVLYPYISKMWTDRDNTGVAQYLKYSGKSYLLIALPLVVLLFLGTSPLINILAQKRIPYGSIMVLLISAGYIFEALFQLRIYSIYLSKRTTNLLIPFLVGTAVNIIGNYLFLPRIGILMAAVMTLIAFLVIYLFIFFGSEKIIHFTIDRSFVMKVLGSSFIMGFVMWFSRPESIYGLVLNSLLGIIVFGALAYMLRFFDKTEVDFVRKIIRGKDEVPRN